MANEVEFSILAKDKFSKEFKSLDARIKKTAKVAAGLGAAFAAGTVIAAKSLIDVGDKTESLRLRINTMIGSVAEGNQVFEDMSKFAGEVPFAYEEIMESATQLSGILKGGSDEIAETMPMIADLAAVSGLSISKTTEQVSRMFSAGAGAADLFRERGINAMLGFEAGVAVSAEETKRRLIEAFEDPASKFRGAADKMATTWTGIMSMIGDKWFNMQSQIADAGLFNYFKSVAITIDKLMGDALANTKDNAEAWSNSIINGMRSVMESVGFLADQFRTLSFVWIELKLLFAGFIDLILSGFDKLANGIINVANLIPGIDISKFDALNGAILLSSESFDELAQEVIKFGQTPIPSDQVKNFVSDVEIEYLKLQAISAETGRAIVDDVAKAAKEAALIAEEFKTLQISLNVSTGAVETEEDLYASQISQLETFYDKKGELDESYYAIRDELAYAHAERLKEIDQSILDYQIANSETFAETFNLTMEELALNAQTFGEETSEIITEIYDNVARGVSQSMADAIVMGDSMSKSLQKVLKSILKSIIAMYIEMAVKRLILAAANNTALTTEAGAEGAKAVGMAAANGVSSWAAAPWPVNIGAPAFGAAMGAAAAGQLAAGMAAGRGIAMAGVAHGGLTNVPAESTYLLDKGERVLSPNQNRDFTDFIASNEEEGAGSSPVIIEQLNIEVTTSASSFDEIEEDELEEFVAGPLIRTLDKLDDNGIRQRALERSNA